MGSTLCYFGWCRTPQTYFIQVKLLDGHLLKFTFKESVLGQEVLDGVYQHLSLIETSYFGLRYIEADDEPIWLDPKTSLRKQFKRTGDVTEIELYFGVKFYTSDPNQLKEQITRYQFYLQLKDDILSSRLALPENKIAPIGALMIQAEKGDFNPNLHHPGYSSVFRFSPNQTKEHELQAELYHKTLVGQSLVNTEYQFLSQLINLDMYGVDAHRIEGDGNADSYVGFSPTALLIFRKKAKIASYPWHTIKKMELKAKNIVLEISNLPEKEKSVVIENSTKKRAKRLYKCTCEHIAFISLLHQGPQNTTESSNKQNGRAKDSRDDTPSKSATVNKTLVKTMPPKEPVYVMSPSQYLRPGRARSEIYAPISPKPQQVPRPESPRSIKSAPAIRGLFCSNPAYLGPETKVYKIPSKRSMSVESRSSTESRPHRRHRHSHRRGSDDESEGSGYTRRRRRSRRSSTSDMDHKKKRESKKRELEKELPSHQSSSTRRSVKSASPDLVKSGHESQHLTLDRQSLSRSTKTRSKSSRKSHSEHSRPRSVHYPESSARTVRPEDNLQPDYHGTRYAQQAPRPESPPPPYSEIPISTSRRSEGTKAPRQSQSAHTSQKTLGRPSGSTSHRVRIKYVSTDSLEPPSSSHYGRASRVSIPGSGEKAEHSSREAAADTRSQYSYSDVERKHSQESRAVPAPQMAKNSHRRSAHYGSTPISAIKAPDPHALQVDRFEEANLRGEGPLSVMLTGGQTPSSYHARAPAQPPPANFLPSFAPVFPQYGESAIKMRSRSEISSPKSRHQSWTNPDKPRTSHEMSTEL